MTYCVHLVFFHVHYHPVKYNEYRDREIYIDRKSDSPKQSWSSISRGSSDLILSCSFFMYDDEKDYAPTKNMNNSNLLSNGPSSILFTPPFYFLLTSHPHPSKSIYVIEYCNKAKSMRIHYNWAECRSLLDNVSFIYLPLFVLYCSKKRWTLQWTS